MAVYTNLNRMDGRTYLNYNRSITAHPNMGRDFRNIGTIYSEPQVIGWKVCDVMVTAKQSRGAYARSPSYGVTNIPPDCVSRIVIDQDYRSYLTAARISEDNLAITHHRRIADTDVVMDDDGIYHIESCDYTYGDY